MIIVPTNIIPIVSTTTVMTTTIIALSIIIITTIFAIAIILFLPDSACCQHIHAVAPDVWSRRAQRLCLQVHVAPLLGKRQIVIVISNTRNHSI